MITNFTGLVKRCLPAVICLGLLGSCTKSFDVEPEDALESGQTYLNIYDADAAVMGIYGQFMGLAERYILMNELRGDLLDVTPNANEYLKQLSTNKITADNPYADPRPFYKIIINCNDAMANFGKMRDKKLLTEVQYYQRYTEVGLLRSWLYLQLGIHFGTIPYVTDPITDLSDLNDESKFPRVSFDQLLDNLIAFTTTIPDNYLQQNTSTVSPTLIMQMGDYFVKDGVFKFFIHRKSFVGDLYLWRNNYLEAAKKYKDVMETGTTLTSSTDYQIDIYDTYRVTNDNSGRFTLMTTGTINPWKGIFYNPLSDAETARERMWILPFNKSYNPKNPFIDLFSASGKYLVKPSDIAIANWENQTRDDGGLRDRRGYNSSYSLDNGKPEAIKQLFTYSPSTPFETNGFWTLYRAAALHLRFAEAANREGRSQLAGALMNLGIATTFPTKISTYNNVNDVYPFDFRANSGTVNGNWYRNIGIRGRAVNRAVTFDQNNLVIDTEDKLNDEAALELAFEGYRWPDLVRIALRREYNNPGTGKAFLNAKLKAKTGVAETFSSLSDIYMPFGKF